MPVKIRSKQRILARHGFLLLKAPWHGGGSRRGIPPRIRRVRGVNCRALTNKNIVSNKIYNTSYNNNNL